MKKHLFALAVATLMAAPLAAADTYTVDAGHSDVSFQVRHLISQVRGNFRDFTATIIKDDAELAKSSVEFTIQATSVDTGIDKRDNHLRSADFFDVEKFPAITFKSSSIVKTGDNTYDVTGMLTMHGVSKEITLPVTFLGEMKDPWGGTRAGFSTATTIDRKEYGIVWNQTLDAGGAVLSDEVQVSIQLETKKQ